MTVEEMHYHIDQGLQKNASFVYSNFEPKEIDAFINKMQIRFIKDRFDRTDTKELGFEAVQKRLDDIRKVIAKQEIDLTAGSLREKSADLNPDYMFFIGGEAEMGYDECAGKPSESHTLSTKLNLVQQDKLPHWKRDPYRKTSALNGVVTTIYGSQINFHGDKRSILKGVTLFYIRTPNKVSLSLQQSCELAEQTHDEIVDFTVQHILEVIESPRYRTNSIQVEKTE